MMKRNFSEKCCHGMVTLGFFLLSVHPATIMAQAEDSKASGSVYQQGKASFYALSLTGNRTANGERLHHDSMTCAHRSLPFGTYLRVTNLLNGKKVVVRVNDRGPFRKGRIIDLSVGAAKAIGMIAQGIVPVTVEKLRSANVPYKPDDDEPEIPTLELEIADIEPLGIKPVWQQDLPAIELKKSAAP